ncbi:MAG: NAD-glutamate dehydrogenase [Trueperaceae bacterium]|nr:NAD-glutamate dehydrogenase [Trueperaceae bacterium]
MSSKQELLRQRLAQGGQGSDGADLLAFATALFDKVDEGFFDAFGPETLHAAAIDSLNFLKSLGTDELKVQAYNPTFEADGWESPQTVVRLALVDRPFIFDSVQAELSRGGFDLVYQLHPLYRVTRDASGKFTALGTAGGRLEAFEMFFINRVDDPDVLRRIEKGVADVLRDVILATSDYRALRLRSQATAVYLRELAARADDSANAPFKAGDEALGPTLGVSEGDLLEAAEFMEWLDDDNFIFLGYREYEIVDVAGEPGLRAGQESSLGILKKLGASAYRDAVPLKDLPPQLRERVTGGRLFIVTKTNAEATVHRARRMDYVGVKSLSPEGTVLGERRFVGLLTTKAQAAAVSDIPILRRKLKQVLELDDAIPGTHDYKEIVAVFNSMPREELFSGEVEQLHSDIRTIISLEQERSARLRLRADPLKRGISAMVMMPRESFNADVRRSIQAFLRERLQAKRVDYRLAMSDEQSHARFHFYFVTDLDPGELDVKDLERTIRELARSWQDEFRERLIQARGERVGRELAGKYGPAFDDSYRADISPVQAVKDVANLERIVEGRPVFDLSNRPEQPELTLLNIYHRDRALALSDVLPTLENLGLRIFEQYPYNLTVDGEHAGVDLFLVQTLQRGQLDLERDRERLLAALSAVFAREAEDDSLNQLVLYAGLTYRQVALLRAYQMYYAQLNSAISRAFVTSSLLSNPGVARLLHDYFEARFDPAAFGGAGVADAARTAAVSKAHEAVVDALTAVSSLAEDQVLRGLLDLMAASVRTNYYLGYERISFKLRSASVGSMPEPRPLFEIAVSSRGFEGAHLRGGMVARGGLRWSDRPDDFRTEVLGLMKTQMTKNAVIVPVGSKGSFVLKDAPTERDALRAYVQAQYQNYLRGLLDLTDNIVDGEVVPPERVLRYDPDDTYLVVAADKGTASFSDLANATAAEYGFWLGDAFASGGSIGYDHKGMGITARGTWRCLERHFAELGMDVHGKPFTVVGIGDMSGDVFGNGLLYSDQTKLVAAFNHLHIFIDPQPDPASSLLERKRLFETRGSTWNDYDRSLISAGGGVFERSSKSIPLSDEMRALLGTKAQTLSGPELIRALLTLPVDLLYNGGIGTYVKASSERNAEVGDAANDAVRVDAKDLRCKMIGEGGNLGLTQLGRIEYALAGGRLDTDAIHNSAGVDTSDHEVNLKIALQPLVAAGKLDGQKRVELLKSMEDEVGELVLRDNARQTLALSLAERGAKADLELYASLLDYLAESGGLNRVVEFLPSSRQLEERRRDGGSFTRPELAVMLAYVKMGLYRRLLETDLPDEPRLAHYLKEYFPIELQGKLPEAVDGHRLRREIAATQMTNTIVDVLGMAFLHRVTRQNAVEPVRVVRASLMALELLGVRELAARVESMGVSRGAGETSEGVGTEGAYVALEAMSGAAAGVVGWLLNGDRDQLDLDLVISRYAPPLARLRQTLEDVLPTAEKRRLRTSIKGLTRHGLEDALASEVAGLAYLPVASGAVDVAARHQIALDEAAGVLFELGDRLSLGWLRDALLHLPPTTEWDAVATVGLVVDLRETQARLTDAYLTARAERGALSVEEFVDALSGARRYQEALKAMKVPGALNLAAGSVLSRILSHASVGGSGGLASAKV